MNMPVVVQRQVSMVQAVQKPVEIPQLQILRQGTHRADSAEACGDSTFADLARRCTTTGAHGLDRSETCGNSTVAVHRQGCGQKVQWTNL